MPRRKNFDREAGSSGARVAMDVGIKRGREAWAFIYTVLGFVLTIETGIVSMIDPLWWPWKLLLLLAIGAGTSYAFLDNGWFQNKLIRIKGRYEDKFR